jgi:GTPase SAR1 family protein
MRSQFFKSPHHATLGLAALACAATGEPLGAIAGGVLYVLGWVYLPDLGFFRRWVERKEQKEVAAMEAGELASFQARRDAALAELAPSRRQRYAELAQVSVTIEKSIGSMDDPRVRKLEELMWTYLRLLSLEQSLERFLELESREDVPRLLAAATEELERLRVEVAKLKETNAPSLSSRERLLESRADLLETLKKRAEHAEQARANHELIIAEQERLDQQVKLLRADTIAASSPAAVSARIDATVEQLEATKSWLREMDQFRAQINEPQLPSQRIGFGAVGSSVPPPIPRDRIASR